MVDADTPAASHERTMLHVSASALRNASCFVRVQLLGEALRICGFLPPTSTSCDLPLVPFRSANPNLRAQKRSGRASRRDRPASQFLTVPAVYRISVTMSRVFFPNRLFSPSAACELKRGGCPGTAEHWKG